MNAQPYELNDDWSKLGPVAWSESSIVTLQVDLESHDEPERLADAVLGWWGAFESDTFQGHTFAYEGGCQMIEPVFIERRPTLWLVSHGQDAFDSIAHYAQQVFDIAIAVDPQVRVVWTELPHQDPAAEQWPVSTGVGQYLTD